MESLETERKEPGGPSPCPAAPWGTRELTGCRCPVHSSSCFWVSSVFILPSSGFSFPLLVPAVSSVRSPRCCPMFTFSCAFLLSSSTSVSLIPASLFLLSVSFSIWRESCPGNPPFSSFGGKDWPQETNPSSCLSETSRLIFFHHGSGTTKAVGHTSGSAEVLLGVYCSFLSIQCGVLWKLLLTFL